MEEDRKRILGRSLSYLGIAWFGLFFAARSGLFGSSQFATAILGMGALFPLVLMFAGRFIKRRATRTPESVESSPAGPSSRPVRPPPPRPPPRRAPEPVTMDDLAEAVKFEMPEETPEPIEQEQIPDSTSSEMEVDGMTSAEMLAEAKKRYSSGNS